MIYHNRLKLKTRAPELSSSAEVNLKNMSDPEDEYPNDALSRM
jgi:hypothetical protein